MKVHILNTNQQYDKMFLSRGWELVDDPAEADLIQFTGGGDVSPDLYGEEKHPTTWTEDERDDYEVGVFDMYSGVIPMAGICRGGQLLWVLNGGSMYQDVDGHALGHTHPIYSLIPDGSGVMYECDVTSTHHQMMKYTKAMASNVLAIAGEGGLRRGMLGDREYVDEGDLDIEVAYFEDTNCLCFQPHPEFYKGKMQDYYFNLIEEHLFGGSPK